MSKDVVYRVKVLDEASGKMRELELAVKRVKAETAGIGKSAHSAEGGISSMGSSMSKMLKGGAILAGVSAVGSAIYSVGKSAVSAAAQVEKYSATLETMLGSKAAARDRMQEYMDIAKTTPFELTQVVEAGNQLQALGRYSEETLTMLGDLAAASGKPLEQVLNAYAKMASGQKGIAVDMFRDLLITTDDWTKATGKGKKASGEMLATSEELIAALPKIMKSKGFFGLMAKQAETTEGKISNLQDAAFSLRAALGERLAPSVKSVVGTLEDWTSSLEKNIRIPVEEKIAKEQAMLNILVGRLLESNDNEQERGNIIAQLKREYPDFLQKIDAEKATTEQLREALSKTKKEYERKIRLAVYGAKMEELQEKAAGAMSTIADVEIGNKAAEKVAQLEARRRELVGVMGWGKDEKYGYYRTEKGKRVYLNSANQKEMMQIDAQLKANRELVRKRATWYGAKKDDKAARSELDATMEQMKTLEGLIEGEGGEESETKSSVSSSAAATSGSSGSGGAAAGSGGGGVTSIGGGGGYGSGRNVTTNIGTLVGELNIHTTTLKQGAAEIKALLTQILTEAVSEI